MICRQIHLFAFMCAFSLGFPLTSQVVVPRRWLAGKSLRQSVPDISVSLYDIQLTFASRMEAQLSDFTISSLSLIYVAGLCSAFSPCEIGLLPLTFAYLNNSEKSEQPLLLYRTQKAVSYAFGISCTLTLFGLSSAYLGSMYGSNVGFGKFSSIFTTILLIVTGLNLLGLLQRLEVPNFPAASRLNEFPEPLNSIVFGATSALVASPCTSPVLTSLLAYISTSNFSPAFGAALLMSFSLGFTSPVVAAGLYSQSAISFKNLSWTNSLLAFVFVSSGVYSLLSLI